MGQDKQYRGRMIGIFSLERKLATYKGPMLQCEGAALIVSERLRPCNDGFGRHQVEFSQRKSPDRLHQKYTKKDNADL